MGEEALKSFRDRFNIPISDAEIADAPFYKPPIDSPEMKYLEERTKELGGFIPKRRKTSDNLEIPDLAIFESILQGSNEKELSTTMAFVRILSVLVKDKTIGKRIVPIVPDEARTFGMEGMFRQLGIYSSVGQLYKPVDRDELMYYREDLTGQILEEGITEAGAMSSWIAAGTSYSNHNLPMIPFYIFYSMFGFQRIGDLAWAAGDMQARGFLLGGTAGRTTLAGEGLQHQDGHSHLLASTIPNCKSYDPAFSYELAVIVHEGLKKMYQKQENIFYYITVMNENYPHPPMPESQIPDIIKGMYLFKKDQLARAQLFGSGAILREVIEAGKILKEIYGISCNIWSITSFNELRREGLQCERWNTLNPEKNRRVPFVEKQLKNHVGPCIATTDYMTAYADQIRQFIPPTNKYVTLGTDGYGRSDSRENLRKHFEIKKEYIVLSTLTALKIEGQADSSQISDVISRFKINPDKTDPTQV